MRRPWLLVVLVLAVLGAGAGVGWALWDDGGDDDDADYSHRLERYDEESGEPNVYVNLPDGDAQLALGSPDRHRLVVQWRDPDGGGWTEPEEVWDGGRLEAVDNTVRYGGGTAAIVQTFTRDPGSDSDIGNVQVAVVCRDLSCEARRAPATEAQVTPDGDTALLGTSGRGALYWTRGDGFRDERFAGDTTPRFADEAVLAPDGSLRLVGSAPARGACTFELFTSGPADADLTSQATVRKPLRGRAESDCGSYNATWSDDWLQVNSDDHRAATFWFVRDGDTWTTTERDASGLGLVDVRRGCCDSATAGFIHWNDVTFASPDGRRIQVQTHLLGQTRWSDPVVLDVAPPRSGCDYLDLQEAGPTGAVLVMRCRGGYALAASTDLETWEPFFYRGPAGEPIGSDDGLRIADVLVWTPEGGFVS